MPVRLLSLVFALVLVVSCGPDPDPEDGASDSGTTADLATFDTGNRDTGSRFDVGTDPSNSGRDFGSVDALGDSSADASSDADAPADISTDCDNPNACGGCSTFAEELGGDCGTCDSGEWVCDGSEALRCAGDDGDDALNSCGSCGDLVAEPGTPCGECAGAGGSWSCRDGTVECVGAPDSDINACGGCDTLEAEPTTDCGTCGLGTWVCDGPELVRCGGDPGEAGRNDCGGCEELSAVVTAPCGDCGDGVFACVGVNDVACIDASPDTDGDGVCDSADRCRGEDDHEDADGDGTPDACDCDLAECAAGADCAESVEGTVCGCPTGFEESGGSCVDVDECVRDLDDCAPQADCANTDGSFTCLCRRGYVGDGRSCSDLDECLEGRDDCGDNATCTNVAGGYTCACDPGYDGDGRTCTDVDECARGLDDCHRDATCTNSSGGYGCACDLGFEGDGRSCTPITEYTFAFPTGADALTGTIRAGVMDLVGATYTGTRAIPLPSISAATTVSFALDTNNICSAGGFPDLTLATVQLRINGTIFGSVILGVVEGEPAYISAADGDTPPEPVFGPPYELELELLYISCGSFDVAEGDVRITVIP